MTWPAAAGLLFVAALCGSVTSASLDSRIHVHVIPHSHCDPGWLESFEGTARFVWIPPANPLTAGLVCVSSAAGMFLLRFHCRVL